MIEANQQSARNLEDLERDLDLPLGWELTAPEADQLRRRVTAERNRGAQERMMRMMAGKRG